jgi:hypothetical protein
MKTKHELAHTLTAQELIDNQSYYGYSDKDDEKYTKIYNDVFEEYLELLNLDNARFVEKLKCDILNLIQDKGKTYGELDEEIYIEDYFVMVKGNFTYTDDAIGFDCQQFDVQMVKGICELTIEMNPSLIDFYHE